LEAIKESELIPEDVFSQISGWLTVKSDYLKIFISAQAKDSKVQKEILVIVERAGEKIKIRYWREN